MSTGAPADKLLSTDPWDVAPLAYWWAEQVVAAARVIPRAVLQTPALQSLEAVTWTLAAAADWMCTVPYQYSAAFMAAEAGVGARVW